MEELQIKVAQQEDINYIVSCSQKQGWNPGLHDAQYYRNADPNGFFVGKIGNQRVCCLSGVKYENGLGHIGFYVVNPEFRKKGYGTKIWAHCMDYLKGTSNVGLDSVLNMKDKYADKYGFKFHNLTVRQEGQGIDDYEEDKNIVSLKDVSFQSLLQYDKGMNPAYRPNFLKQYIQMPDSLAVGYVKQNKLQGYIIVKKASKGYKVSPLFADSEDVANALLMRARKFVGSKNILYINIPDTNQHAVKLAQSHRFKKILACARMYTNEPPKIDEDRVYGITATQIG